MNNGPERNGLVKNKNTILRILEIKSDMLLLIDCVRKNFPGWVEKNILAEFEKCPEDELYKITDYQIPSELSPAQEQSARQKYTVISAVLPFVGDSNLRSKAIKIAAENNRISPQTVKKYLCKYLAYQNINCLAKRTAVHKKSLSKDEKNIRWSLNKFFYSESKLTLRRCYEIMLKEKYCDKNGVLQDSYPSFYQYRYFYRKYKKLETYYISRHGLKDYQKNHRPLTGNGIQDFAPTVGVGMADSTICDIYLIDDAQNLVGRPILTACVDAYSGLCMGYSLSWEGGVYSINNLLQNIIADKTEHCRKFGIELEKDSWNTDKLPGKIVTDMGSEYKSANFEQIAELGITVVNLPAYRPELKGAIEKFFDVIQNLFKPQLKGKGVIEPDFRQRGSHDYRKDACLTMRDFEKIILHCIIYCNTRRVLDKFLYTEDMLQKDIKPYSMNIFDYAKSQPGANLIKTTPQKLALTMLPRTEGVFSRMGLKVNKLRYNNDDFTEEFLKGGICTVAYNPDDSSYVWLVDNGKYTKFRLIESRFEHKGLTYISQMKTGQNEIVKSVSEENLQAKLDLMEHIRVISDKSNTGVNTKNIRKSRQREQIRTHINFAKEGAANE